MRFAISYVVFDLVLAGSLTGCASPTAPDRNPEHRADRRAILEEGRATESLPAGLVVRLEAHLSRGTPADPALRARKEAEGVDFSKVLDEIWEFSSDRVHRVTLMPDETGTKRIYRRVESVPIDASGICEELLSAQILALAERQGSGNDNFAGTDYDQGEHMIELLQDGQPILSVGESCVEAGFAEEDARAFARLYETLAVKARKAFAVEEATDRVRRSP